MQVTDTLILCGVCGSVFLAITKCFKSDFKTSSRRMGKQLKHLKHLHIPKTWHISDIKL